MKSLTNSGTRAICAGLVVLAAVGWSCTKEPFADGDTGPQAKGAVAQARSFYESTATPLSKTVEGQSIAIKPLPGEMNPLWDQAAATVLSDGTASWVDVPVEATITYTAVRGGFHHHGDGDACDYDNISVQTVQKLSVYTAPDGTKQSLVATIVPEADCKAEFNRFSSDRGYSA